MQHNAASQSGSPLTENTSSLRARKMSSTGGNRSWSEEEETYLLQTRMQKMPYKHIAAHLKKTELACRLHYHQLSHGSHRRKRTASVSSNCSTASTGTTTSSINQSPISYTSPIDEESSSAATSPRQSPSYDARQAYAAANPTAHKPLLPKPHQPMHQAYPVTPQASPEPALPPLRINTNTAPASFPPSTTTYSSVSYPSAYSAQQHSYTPSTASSYSSHTAYPHSTTTPQQPQPVDPSRLHKIYEAHRSAFWSTVAAEYGADASPAVLEDVWKRGTGLGVQSLPSILPPSPARSPDGSITKWEGWTTVQAEKKVAKEKQGVEGRKRSGSGALPIAAILTEDKNPRPDVHT